MITKFNLDDFLLKYPYALQLINENDIEIDTLSAIYKDYVTHMDAYQNHGDFIANILRSQRNIHTVKSRMKEPDRLIEKVIRKTADRKKGQSARQPE